MNKIGEMLRWFRYITVEPTMFLYMFAFQLTSVVEQELFVRKTCIANFNFTQEICDNLSDKKYKNYSELVHVSVQLNVFGRL